MKNTTFSTVQLELSSNICSAQRCGVRWVAKTLTIDNVGTMRPAQASFRTLTWCCVILLEALSLLPGQDMVRTGISGRLEHFVAYAGSASIAIVGYGGRGAAQIIALFWICAGILEYLQHFRRAVIDQSQILRHRPLERSSEGAPQTSSCVAWRRAHTRTSSDLTAAMAPTVKINGRMVTIVPGGGTRREILIQGLNCCLARLCLVVVAMLPLSAVAQITDPLPLLPYAAAPGAPHVPAPPGEQPTYAGETVTSRRRPEFDPIGLRLGDFFWFPRAELSESYNSNIFATTTNATSDLITTLQPGFDLLSIFPRHSLNLHGGSVGQFYARHSAQNTQDGTVNVDGQLQVTTGSSFYGDASVAHQHISYGSPNSPGTPNSPANIAQPVTYWDYTARAGYVEQGRRLSYQVDAGVEAAQYNAAQLVGGGVLPQSSQDAIISSASVRGNYELVPDYLGYVRLGGSLYDYWHAVGNNSSTYRISTGLQILPRHIIYGEAYVGYLVQNYARSGLGSTAAPDYGGRLVWNVSRLTTLTFNGLRAFNTGTPTAGETAITGPAGNGYLASTVTANADHELLRNLLVNLNGTYENDSFQGIARNDNVFTAGAGLRYLVNRNLFLGGTFSYYQRSSTAAGASFSQNILMLRVGTQF